VYLNSIRDCIVDEAVLHTITSFFDWNPMIETTRFERCAQTTYLRRWSSKFVFANEVVVGVHMIMTNLDEKSIAFSR
jgi:hypothetical protein